MYKIRLEEKDDLRQIIEAKPLVDYILSLEGHLNIHDIMTESRITVIKGRAK